MLRSFIYGLQAVDSISRPITIYFDNSVIVFFSKNNKSYGRSKHIDIKNLVVREKVKKGKKKIEHIDIKAIIVDPLTKGLVSKVFTTHVANMGIVKTFDFLVNGRYLYNKNYVFGLIPLWSM